MLKKILYNGLRVLGRVLVMRKILFIFLSLFCFAKFQVVEAKTVSIPILVSETTIGIEQKEERMNVFENFYYRLFEKDTKDFFDYVLLGIFIVGLLIVMVLQNTHYYTVMVPYESEKFLEEPNNENVIEEVTKVEEVQPVEEAKPQVEETKPIEVEEKTKVEEVVEEIYEDVKEKPKKAHPKKSE